MDYYLNNQKNQYKPLLNEYNNNIYQNHRLKYQNNSDILRNDSIFAKKLISKKYNTSNNSPYKLIQDSSQYIKDKSQILMLNRIKKIHNKKNNNINFDGNSANYINKNYNINNVSNSNFAYNHNLLNYYNNNSLENNINNNRNNSYIFKKKLNYNDYYLENENSYINKYNSNYISNNEKDIISNNINNNNFINNNKKSDNKLVKNILNENNFKKISKDKIFMKQRIFNPNNNNHQKIRSNENIIQDRTNKIYNLKKNIIKYNNDLNNNSIKPNNYLINPEKSKINQSLNKNNMNNKKYNLNQSKNQLNKVINSLESLILIENIKKNENKMKLKKVTNSKLRKKIKEKSEISNEVGGTSSSNIKTTFFSSFNNMNKIYNNDNSISIMSKSNNNFNNLIIKEYKEKEKDKDKIKYNSTNNSFNKKIYQKKISQKEFLMNNNSNSISNIKLKNIKKSSNINIVSPNIIYNNNSIIESKYNNKDKSQKNRKEIIINNNSSYKTNEFENRNISEFPINENIIKENLDEHNNLYINNNNIKILNQKSNKEDIKNDCNNKEDNINANNNKEDNKEFFNSIQSSDTLINKEKNLQHLNENIIENNIHNKNINNDNKDKESDIKLDIKIDINDNKSKSNKLSNNNNKQEDIIIIPNEEKAEIIKNDSNNNIDINFLKEKIIKRENKDNDKNINNNIKKEEKDEKKLEININNNINKESIDKKDLNKEIINNKKEDKSNINNEIIINIDNKNNKKEKEVNDIILNDDENIIIETQLNNSKTKNKRELYKINEKLNNLFNQDMLCNPSQPKNVKSLSHPCDLTKTKESTYYQNEQQKLSMQIKDFYLKEKKYPKSDLNYYLYGRQIGHGAFGQVNLALHIGSGRLVAIKIFAKKNLKNTRAKEKIMTEIETLSNFHHPFINQILDNFETETHIFIVIEYVCGDLLGFIRKRGKLSESVSKIIFKQLIEGIKYIHKKHFVHRDIKLDNILIDLTNTIKICDFGVSRHFEDKNEILFDHCGTPAYIAPEIFEHNGYKGPPCDIWSAGVTLYYMLSGEQPFKAGSISELEKIIKAGEFKEIEGVSKEANNLINKILQVNPKSRLSVDEILNHKWLDKVDLSQRNKLNLFTEAEKILMSKFNVNYLNSDNKSELIENFTLKNIEDGSNNKNKGNTKSIIFAPYNTFIDEFEKKDKKNVSLINSLNEEIKTYKEIEIRNDICQFGMRVQQLNIQYELSNNGDFDNGLIKTEKQEDFQKENEKIEKMFEIKKGKKWKNKEKYDDENEIVNPRKDILEKIEKEVGYKCDYVIKCIKQKKINYATATYYLLEKDEQFN